MTIMQKLQLVAGLAITLPLVLVVLVMSIVAWFPYFVVAGIWTLLAKYGLVKVTPADVWVSVFKYFRLV